MFFHQRRSFSEPSSLVHYITLSFSHRTPRFDRNHPQQAHECDWICGGAFLAFLCDDWQSRNANSDPICHNQPVIKLCANYSQVEKKFQSMLERPDFVNFAKISLSWNLLWFFLRVQCDIGGQYEYLLLERWQNFSSALLLSPQPSIMRISYPNIRILQI